MVSLKLARALEPEGFTVVALHPGRVDTEMGHNGAEISAEESARKSYATGLGHPCPILSASADPPHPLSACRSLATFAAQGPAQSGTLWSYTGEQLTW